jgi:hypothetical protein
MKRKRLPFLDLCSSSLSRLTTLSYDEDQMVSWMLYLLVL